MSRRVHSSLFIGDGMNTTVSRWILIRKGKIERFGWSNIQQYYTHRELWTSNQVRTIYTAFENIVSIYAPISKVVYNLIRACEGSFHRASVGVVGTAWVISMEGQQRGGNMTRQWLHRWSSAVVTARDGLSDIGGAAAMGQKQAAAAVASVNVGGDDSQDGLGDIGGGSSRSQQRQHRGTSAVVATGAVWVETVGQHRGDSGPQQRWHRWTSAVATAGTAWVTSVGTQHWDGSRPQQRWHRWTSAAVTTGMTWVTSVGQQQWDGSRPQRLPHRWSSSAVTEQRDFSYCTWYHSIIVNCKNQRASSESFVSALPWICTYTSFICRYR